MRTLFDISDDLTAIIDQLDEAGGEASDDLFTQYLQADGEARAKLDNYGALILELRALAAERREHAKRLTELARIDEDRAKRMLTVLNWHMERTGQTRLDLPRCRITRAKKGKRRIEWAVDPEVLAEFVSDELVTTETVTKTKIDDRGLRALLDEAGGALDDEAGTRLVAYEPDTHSVRVK